MLYLAQVSQQGETGEISLLLLARQKSAHHWVLPSNQNTVSVSPDSCAYDAGVLVLVDLTREFKVESIQDAKDWVLDLIKKYLVAGINPNVLQEEAARAEEWRKELTLKTQDLARRALELETRRDQIQELEKKLEIERQQLESMRLKVDANDSSSDDLNHNEGEKAEKHLAETQEAPAPKAIEQGNHAADAV